MPKISQTPMPIPNHLFLLMNSLDVDETNTAQKREKKEDHLNPSNKIKITKIITVDDEEPAGQSMNPSKSSQEEEEISQENFEDGLSEDSVFDEDTDRNKLIDELIMGVDTISRLIEQYNRKREPNVKTLQLQKARKLISKKSNQKNKFKPTFNKPSDSKIHKIFIDYKMEEKPAKSRIQYKYKEMYRPTFPQLCELYKDIRKIKLKRVLQKKWIVQNFSPKIMEKNVFLTELKKIMPKVQIETFLNREPIETVAPTKEQMTSNYTKISITPRKKQALEANGKKIQATLIQLQNEQNDEYQIEGKKFLTLLQNAINKLKRIEKSQISTTRQDQAVEFSFCQDISPIFPADSLSLSMESIKLQ